MTPSAFSVNVARPTASPFASISGTSSAAAGVAIGVACWQRPLGRGPSGSPSACRVRAWPWVTVLGARVERRLVRSDLSRAGRRRRVALRSGTCGSSSSETPFRDATMQLSAAGSLTLHLRAPEKRFPLRRRLDAGAAAFARAVPSGQIRYAQQIHRSGHNHARHVTVPIETRGREMARLTLCLAAATNQETRPIRGLLGVAEGISELPDPHLRVRQGVPRAEFRLRDRAGAAK